MVFAFLSLEQGLQISVSVWNSVYFLPCRLWNTVGMTILLPESRYERALLLFPLGSRCTFTQTRRFRLDGKLRLTFFILEQGIYFHNFVWNRVENLRLFSLEQGQVPLFSDSSRWASRLRTDRHFVSRISVLAAVFCDHEARQELVHRLSLRPVDADCRALEIVPRSQ